MLSARGLDLEAGGRRLATGLDLDLAAGEVWAVLGCNGSGKSTLLATLAGLVRPAAGGVEVGGRALAAWPRRALAREAGLLLQREEHDYWGTLADYVRLGRYPHAAGPFGADAPGAAAVAAALAAFDLVARAGQRYTTLSGGERQRARLAQLWAQAPRLLLLDEPLQHLDLRHQVQAMAAIGAAARSAGRAALVVLHDLTFAAQCDRVLLLHGDGRHAQGPAAAMLEPARLEALYGCRLAACGGAAGHIVPVI